MDRQKAGNFLYSILEPKSYCTLLIILLSGQAQAMSSGSPPASDSHNLLYISVCSTSSLLASHSQSADLLSHPSIEQLNSQIIDSRVHGLIYPTVINKPLFIFTSMYLYVSDTLSKLKSHY